MKNKTFYQKTVMTLVIILISFATKAQTTKENPIAYYEDCIINKTIPTEQYDYKYVDNMRIIVWNDKLISNYKYSNEEFDKLGYDYFKTTSGDKNQSSKIYRNCSKGTVIEVTEWYNVKLSISIKWYPINIRKSIGYMLGCGLNKQKDNIKTEEKIKGTLYKASFYGKNVDEAFSNPTYSKVEVIIGDSSINVTLGTNTLKYDIVFVKDLSTGKSRTYNGIDDDYLLTLDNVSYFLGLKKVQDSKGVYYMISLYGNISRMMDKEIWVIPEATLTSN